MLIGLIGLPQLDILGIRWVCGRMGWSVRVAERDDESLHIIQECDLLIVAAPEIALYPDRYTTRKNHIIIFDESLGSASKSRRLLTRDMAESEIVTRLNAVADTLNSDDSGDRADHEPLSARETEVLREVASGKTNKEIADSLCISVNTVITHRKNLTSKLGIRSASGLSLYALMHGLIGPHD